MSYSTVTFGGETLEIESVTPTRNQKTIKQRVGRTLVQMPIVGLTEQQWQLQLQGVITGTAGEMDTARTNLQALDDVDPHAYVDGIHDGTYIVQPGSLQFQDKGGETHAVYRYTIVLVEQ